MQKIILKKNEERRLLAGHLWIYSNEIDNKETPLKKFAPGELVQIFTASNQMLGIGYINPNTLLCARLLTRSSTEKIDTNFFTDKISRAFNLRGKFFLQPFYRLVYAESDNLPGLIIDRYGEYFVVQITTCGMEQLKNFIIAALVELFNPVGVLFKNESDARELEGLKKYTEVVYGAVPETLLMQENDVEFYIPVILGQKTGWFYDQRNNRKLILPFIKDKIVLDLYAYVGSFAILAAVHGAKEVIAVDSSALAIEFINKNANLNKVENIVIAKKADVFTFLSGFQRNYFDCILLDPPALIKRAKDINSGTALYLKLHCLALQLLKAGGILITSSCSMHLMRDQLLDVIRKASLKENKSVKIVQQLHQAPDHPLHPAIKETEYLKGFAVYIA